MSHPHGAAPLTFGPFAALTWFGSLAGLFWQRLQPIVAQAVPAAADAAVTWQFVALSAIGLGGMVVKGVFNHLDRRLRVERLELENELYREHYGPPPPKPRPGG